MQPRTTKHAHHDNKLFFKTSNHVSKPTDSASKESNNAEGVL